MLATPLMLQSLTLFFRGVAVTAGAAYITATPSGRSSQVLRARLSANENVTIAANSSGSTKYDFLYINITP